MLELPTLLWKEYKFPICMIAAIVGVLYLSSLRDAAMNPWTLWRQEWRRDWASDQRRMASYRAGNDCVEEQRKKLKEEFELKEQSNTILGKKTPNGFNFRTVAIQEGATIFQYSKPSLYFFKNRPSNPAQIQTEIVATVSFFCAPTSSLYGVWPYYTPNYSAASDSLKRLGEKALAIQAKQLLGD
jgi:hypothetical protein